MMEDKEGGREGARSNEGLQLTWQTSTLAMRRAVVPRRAGRSTARAIVTRALNPPDAVLDPWEAITNHPHQPAKDQRARRSTKRGKHCSTTYRTFANRVKHAVTWGSWSNHPLLLLWEASILQE